MAKQVTTLFIEDTAVRLLVARGKQAEKWSSVPLEAGLVKHGLIQDKAKVAEKIRETLRSIKASSKVILGLSEPGSLYRIITLPKLPADILAEAVKREAERVIPLPQNEIYLAYQVISTRQDDMQLFLAAFSRNAVDTLTSTMQMAGIKPSSLDLVPLALCRAIDRSTAIVVSLRSSNFEIAIMVDRIPQVIRSLSLPGEAESLLDKLPTIAEELERTVSFYNSGHNDKPLDAAVPVFVDGELTQVPDAWPSLVGNLGSTVSPLPSLMQASADFDAGQFTVNIGLALKEAERDNTGIIINFNALPSAFQPEKPKLSRMLIPIGAGVGVLILVFIFLQTNTISADVKSLDSEQLLAQGRVTQLTKEVASIKEQIKGLEDKKQPLQDKINFVNSDIGTFSKTTTMLNDRRDQVNVDTSKIISLAPTSITISSLSFAEAIAITGTAKTDADAFMYARSLSDTALFNSVVLNVITLNDDGTYEFALSIMPK